MLFYRIISILLFPFLEIYLLYRVYKKKEDKHRLQERFGKPSIARPESQMIWVHAVSVGEANSAITIIEELLKFFPQTSILLTTTTITSAAIIKNKLPDFKGRVLHQFLPLDSYFCVQDFLNFWKVRAALFVESEIWPNFIYEARQRGICSFLINARISNKSFKRWQLAKSLGINIFDYFAAIFVQMKDDVEKFESLTEQEILFYGNLKSEAQVLKINHEELKKLQAQIDNRKTWLAASTHKGEEEIILATHQELKKEFPDLLTIIAPRHPKRAAEIIELLNGVNFSQRSKNETIKNSTEIYLADSLGELGIFYSLVNFSFIGGSFVDVGGHNPFEAIQLNCAVMSGAKVANFKEIYKKLNDQKACIILRSQDQLINAVRKFLPEKELCQEFINNARNVMMEQAPADNIASQIVSKIDRILMLEV